MKVAIRGVYAQRKRLASGRVAVYYRHRATGARLPDDPTSLAFREAVERLDRGGRPRPPETAPDREDTVSAMFRRYLDSGVFSSLAPGTRTGYRRHLALVEPFIGKHRVRDVTRAHVSRILDAFKDAPYLADGVRRTLSAVWSYGVDELGLVDANPLVGMASRTPRKPHEDGQTPAEEHEIAAFRAAVPRGTRARLLFEILLSTALRISDAGKVGAAAIRSGLVSLSSTKTVEPSVAAVGEELRLAFLAYEEACLAEGRPLGRYALGESAGEPLHKRTLAKDLTDAFAAARWPDGKRAHSLRYAAAVRLHELGWTVDRIKLVTGHRMAAMAEKYVAKKREAPVVREAIDRIDAANAAGLIAGPPARRDFGDKGASAAPLASSPSSPEATPRAVSAATTRRPRPPTAGDATPEPLPAAIRIVAATGDGRSSRPTPRASVAPRSRRSTPRGPSRSAGSRPRPSPPCRPASARSSVRRPPHDAAGPRTARRSPAPRRLGRRGDRVHALARREPRRAERDRRHAARVRAARGSGRGVLRRHPRPQPPRRHPRPDREPARTGRPRSSRPDPDLHGGAPGQRGDLDRVGLPPRPSLGDQVAERGHHRGILVLRSPRPRRQDRRQSARAGLRRSGEAERLRAKASGRGAQASAGGASGRPQAGVLGRVPVAAS